METPDGPDELACAGLCTCAGPSSTLYAGLPPTAANHLLWLLSSPVGRTHDSMSILRQSQTTRSVHTAHREESMTAMRATSASPRQATPSPKIGSLEA